MGSATAIAKAVLRHEVKASAFYNLAAEITHNDESRMVFLELVEMEDGHTQELVKKITNTHFASDFDPQAYIRELEATVDTTIRQGDSRVVLEGDMKQVLEFAIAMEEEAVENYGKMAAHAENDDVKQFCEEQVVEEQSHIKSLRQLLQSLDMDAEDRPEL
jgi:rubrerythrin